MLVLRLKISLLEDACASMGTWYAVTNKAICQLERYWEAAKRDDRRKFGSIASSTTLNDWDLQRQYLGPLNLKELEIMKFQPSLARMSLVWLLLLALTK